MTEHMKPPHVLDARNNTPRKYKQHEFAWRTRLVRFRPDTITFVDNPRHVQENNRKGMRYAHFLIATEDIALALLLGPLLITLGILCCCSRRLSGPPLGLF